MSAVPAAAVEDCDCPLAAGVGTAAVPRSPFVQYWIDVVQMVSGPRHDAARTMPSEEQ